MMQLQLFVLSLLALDVVAQVPLFRRAPTGSVEDNLPQLLERMRMKYGGTIDPRQANTNHRRDAGWVSLETGEVVNVGSKKKKRLSRVKRQSSGKSSTMSIINLQHDTSYSAPICIGTPTKCFNVVLDTGSSDLWLAGKTCQKCPANTVTFDPAASSTFASRSQNISLTYVGGSVQGVVGSDIAAFPTGSSSQPTPFVVANQTFSVMDAVGSGVVGPQVSGLVGLAFQPVAVSRAVPIWQTLAQRGALTVPQMSFYFTRHALPLDAHGVDEAPLPGGQFTLGGTNSSLYSGAIDFVNIPQGFATADGHWNIPLSSIGVDSLEFDLSNTTTVGGQLAAIDTGSSSIGGPPDVVRRIYSNVKGTLRGIGANTGSYFIPCNTTTQVSFTFTSRTWNIPARDLAYGSDDPTGEYCVGAFFEVNIGQPGQVQWIVGQSFLKNVYTVLQYDPPAVGFAQLSGVDGSLPFPDTSGILVEAPSVSGTADTGAPQSKVTGGASRAARGGLFNMISAGFSASALVVMLLR